MKFAELVDIMINAEIMLAERERLRVFSVHLDFYVPEFTLQGSGENECELYSLGLTGNSQND